MFPILFRTWNTYAAVCNIGTALGIACFAYAFHKRISDKRKLMFSFLALLTLILSGTLGSHAVRMLNTREYGSVENAVVQIVFHGEGSHFIGRVMFTAWLFPIVFLLLQKVFPVFRQDREKLVPCILDAVSFYFVVQHICNRIACFGNGCCFGKLYNGIGAVTYRYGVAGAEGIRYSVYPSQLMEAVGMLLILLVLIKRYRRGKPLFGIMLILFGITIFLSEFFMDQRGIRFFFGMNVIQHTAILTVFTGSIYCILNKKREQGEERKRYGKKK